jgi:D-threo-aldose 1-dehydrogenase
MRSTSLGGTGIETTVLGFGCADLFRAGDAHARRRLLAGAFEVGIRHFDTAPMYGLGHAERALGAFAQGRRRDELVIATKFGIVATVPARLLGVVQGPLQRTRVRDRTRPSSTDPRDGAIGLLLYRGSTYDARVAQRSLIRSLRQLRTDYIDLFLLHDPRPGDMHSDDVREYLESARSAGLIRAWGAAGEPAGVADSAVRLGPLPVVQVRHDVFAQPLQRSHRSTHAATIIFGVIARALPRILAHLGPDVVRRRWSEALGTEASDPETIAMLLLRDAIAKTGGPVLFSTTRSERLAAAAIAAASRSDNSTLNAFRSLVSEIRESPG